MSGSQIRRRATVHGHVQGVFFRDTTRQQAHAHGVAGWVRNNPDGSVEAVLEGAPGDVQRMLQFLTDGPPEAQVERVDVSDEEPDGLSAFEIR